jgi:hypothetical protein
MARPKTEFMDTVTSKREILKGVTEIYLLVLRLFNSAVPSTGFRPTPFTSSTTI